MSRKKEKVHKPEEKKGFSLLKISLLIFFISSTLFLQLTYQFKDKVFAQSNNPEVSAKPKDSNDDLSNLEEKIFHEQYTKDPTEERLSRIEDFLFGRKYSSQSIENRISKINTALQPALQPPVQEKTNIETLKPIEPEHLEIPSKPEEPKVVYDEGANTGVIGTISEIENKVFGMTFNETPFQKRVENLGFKILSNLERNKSMKKPLIERVSILVKKVEPNAIRPDTPPIIPNRARPNYPQSYTIDPRNGFLINEQTREIIKDSYGNPITVRIPTVPQELQQIPQNPNYGYQGQNQFAPYGNFPQQQGGLPGQIPYDLLFNQGGLDPGVGGDPGY